MPTKFGRWCEGMMEALWLAAMVVTPLFFNLFSSRIFEPDKIAILRTIAVFLLVLWIAKLVSEGIDWGGGKRENKWYRDLLKVPLVIPILLLIAAYLIASIFSIVPSISFWGSYQRLQGTYTFFSYLIVFFVIIANLRGREQINRLITVIILTSIPVTLYGILQHYSLDPVLWAGDVVTRIASTLGNSIFIAAYLIMVFPLTLVRIITSVNNIISRTENTWSSVLRCAGYTLIAGMQIIAIYFSGSRGPVLGWMASIFFMVLILTIYWQRRWATILWVSAALIVSGFLFVFNIEKGPLEPLRSLPSIGRFGLLLDPDSNSAKVRRYIWEGAADLMSPHKPLAFPDGNTDKFNSIRPFVGYGPESMYVVFNPFYDPQLGVVERRNAAPDRSHNETWDSLVFTGIFGFIAYLGLFGAIFYFGFKSMKLIQRPFHMYLYWGLFLAGGVVGAIVTLVWRGSAYIGVGIPFGILIGLILYATIFGLTKNVPVDISLSNLLILLGLLTAILANFVEINFGIAMSVSRLYFWTFSALLVVTGYFLPSRELINVSADGEQMDNSIPMKDRKGITTRSGAQEMEDKSKLGKNLPEKTGARRKYSAEKSRSTQNFDDSPRLWLIKWRSPLIGGLLLSLILITLGYNFITTNQVNNSLFSIIWRSITTTEGGTVASGGLLALLSTTWLLGSILLALESESNPGLSSLSHSDFLDYLRSLGIIMLSSFLISLVYWCWQAGSLATITGITITGFDTLMSQVNRYTSLISHFYLTILVVSLGLSVLLSLGKPFTKKQVRWQAVAALGVGVIIASVFAISLNLRNTQADIAFKLTDSFNHPGAYNGAIAIYSRINQLAPNEDYYYLYQGRTYLEQAKTITDPEERDQLIQVAVERLEKAQSLNPLNTDHTANLARLYSSWTTYTQDVALKEERALQSDQYFREATNLSPNNVRLWVEWAYLLMQQLENLDEAYAKLIHARELDPSYDWTYGLLGEYYTKLALSANDPESKTNSLNQAVSFYQEAIRRTGDLDLKYNYNVGLGGVLAQLGLNREAIQAYQDALLLVPEGANPWRLYNILARLYWNLGDTNSALTAAQSSMQNAPESEKTAIQEFIDQIQE